MAHERAIDLSRSRRLSVRRVAELTDGLIIVVIEVENATRLALGRWAQVPGGASCEFHSCDLIVAASDEGLLSASDTV